MTAYAKCLIELTCKTMASNSHIYYCYYYPNLMRRGLFLMQKSRIPNLKPPVYPSKDSRGRLPVCVSAGRPKGVNFYP